MVGSRKHHLLGAIALIVLVLASCLLEQVDGKRSRSSKRGSSYKRAKDVNIEIYYPKGVMIWYPYRAGIQSFSIEIFINKPTVAQQQSSDESSSDSASQASEECDICLTTSEVKYGKFILRSPDAVVRARDHLLYNAIVTKTDGREYTTRSNEFYVSESRILLGSMGESNASSCQTAVGPVAQDQQQRDELKLLEDTLLELYQQCDTHANRTKNLLVKVETPTRYKSRELYQYTEQLLEQMMPEIGWSKTLVDANYYNNWIAIDVASMVDKLKALHLGKANGTIVDLDEVRSNDQTNEIDWWN